MDYIAIGKMIKQLRKNKGMSQTKLAEGIMSAKSLGKLERGNQAINKINLDKLISKLGYVAKRFFAYPLTEGEFHAFELHRQFKIESRKGNKEKMDTIIKEMESMPEFKSDLHKQQLLKYKADILSQPNASTLPEALQLYNKAIRMSYPKFAPNLVNLYFLSSIDRDTIGAMASTMYELGQKANAINLLEKLAANVNNKIIDGHEKARAMAFALYLLSKYLGLERRHEEALAACNKGIEVSEANEAFNLLPDLNFNKACGLHYTGKHEDVHEYLYKAYYCAIAHGNKKIAEEIMCNAKLLFNVAIR
ncbi:MAG: helix-turn-helix transcriptional regulator [Defluviitaleaceae bacterium]|nr:helix-turn-helix transcriptional regulator [Defluviitaleaceae bacterium]